MKKKEFPPKTNFSEERKKGINLKKGIVNYNMKLEENKKKFIKKENNQINLETNLVDVPYYIDGNLKKMRGIKNKMLIIKSENEPHDGFKYSNENFFEKSINKSLKNSGNGTVYKTHTFRQKFSNPHFVFEQLSLNAKFSNGDEKINILDYDLEKSMKFEEDKKKGKNRNQNKIEENVGIDYDEKKIEHPNDDFNNNYEDKNIDPNPHSEVDPTFHFNNLNSNDSAKLDEKDSASNFPVDIEKNTNNINTNKLIDINTNSDKTNNPKFYSQDNSNFNDFKKLNLNPFKTTNTIYTMLTKRKNEFMENIKKNKNLANHSRINEKDFNLIQNFSHSNNYPFINNRRKSFMKRNPVTYLMEKKVMEDIPHVYPIVWIHQNDYENISEKNRYEKITHLFLKLRYYIENDEENEKNYLKEFMMKHGIYEDKFYAIDKLNNFMNFLKSESISKLNPNKTIKDIIIDATNFDRENLENQIENSDANENQQIRKNSKKINTKGKKNTYQNFNENNNSNLNNFNSNNKKYYRIDHDRFNMANYLSHPQPILNEKIFKIKNETIMIDKLEKEMDKLRLGEGGLNFNVNESSLANMKILSRHESDVKNISEDYYSNASLKNDRKKMNKSKKENEESYEPGNNLKLPLVKNEIDIDLVKKKNKLLEYIVLNRTKSRILWNNSNDNLNGLQ